jgi:hypothetical protein
VIRLIRQVNNIVRSHKPPFGAFGGKTSGSAGPRLTRLRQRIPTGQP